jgi:WhiB family transcriptional regulator, redox-sensing transcriptional regulator
VRRRPGGQAAGGDRGFAFQLAGKPGRVLVLAGQAACRSVGSTLFYSPDGERGSHKRRRERAAKAICATCPVVEVCAAYALACRETHGTWGGLSESDRETIYAGLDPAKATADYRRALAAWHDGLVLPLAPRTIRRPAR